MPRATKAPPKRLQKEHHFKEPKAVTSKLVEFYSISEVFRLLESKEVLELMDDRIDCRDELFTFIKDNGQITTENQIGFTL